MLFSYAEAKNMVFRARTVPVPLYSMMKTRTAEERRQIAAGEVKLDGQASGSI
jgi:hypothetical protein